MAMRPQSRVHQNFDCLLERMRRRCYPETMHVLAFYWLRTVCTQGYQQTEWKELDLLLEQACADPQATPCLLDLREWIPQIRSRKNQPARDSELPFKPARQVNPDVRAHYLFRLLNEWLPVEIAHLLVREPAQASDESGIRAVVVARAIERLLLRENLSQATLESILAPGCLSPRLIYPADFEILQDVVLFLLGRTTAPALPKLPAVLLCASSRAPLSLDYAKAVSGASLTAGPSEVEELHVEIPPSQTMDLVRADPVRFTSAIVTMDGRLWQADRLQRGERDCIIYRSAGPLRIDYSVDHARITIPWTEARWRWSGLVWLSTRVEMFGREWRVSRWEQDAARTLLHLTFVASLPMIAIEPSAPNLRRSHPAAIDMAWAALESALAASMVQRSLDPIEQLRRDELVPLGRALFGLAELRTLDSINQRLKGIRYLSAELSSTYGPVPWRILPKAIRKTLLAGRIYQPLRELLQQVFAGLPDSGNDRSLLRLWARHTPRAA